MFWTVLILLLLAAIGAALWLHYRQDKDWQDELAHMKAGAADGEELPRLPDFTERTETAEQSGSAAGVYERLQSLLTQFQRPEETEPEAQEPVYIQGFCKQADVPSEKAAVQDSFDLFPEVAEEEDYAPLELDLGNRPSETETAAVSQLTGKPRLSHAPEPYIVPFVETEAPDYAPRKVEGADFDEITLEEATRSLGEAAVQERAEKMRAKKPVWAEMPSETAPRAVLQPDSRLEVIDLDDPALRRTRERVLADVDGIHIGKAQKPRIESAQTALKTLEREPAVRVDIPSRWDRIDDLADIHHNLARQSAARKRLAEAVAPVRDFRPQVIPDEEVWANLSHTSSALTRRNRPIRRIDTSTRESVIPDAVRVSSSAAKVQPPKSVFPPKTSRYQNEVFISRPAPPTATVVEPPVVPPTAPVPLDIPEPAVVPEAPPPAAVDFPEPPKFSGPAVVPEVNAHISTSPERTISDYLISESVDAESGNLQTASAAEKDDAAVDVFEHGAVRVRETGAVPSGHHAVRPVFQTASNSLMPSENAAYDDKHLPTVSLLRPPQFDPSATQSEEALLENSITIEEKLAEFKVKVKVVDSYSGPVITRYEIEPDVGVRGNAVLNLEKDLARSLGVASIRVVETIPGKTCMGLELPNPRRQMIRLSEIFNSPAFTESKSKLTLALGQDITGEPVVTDLAKAPHLLVAGTTGSGKSVGVNAMILSMLFKATPEDVRMIMIDPKMLELSIYEGIPHLLAPVVTDMKLAANALNWCVNEMEKRYRLMSHAGVRNLAGFNQKIAEAAARGEKLANPFSLTPDDPEPLEKLPFIVVVVDEFADLMMTAGKKIEELIARLAQKARAAGIHLILATQRPSVDVITGLIKANIPTRIAFQVSSKIDSRTILDQMGAENLLGQGDMLFLPPGTGYPQRVHGAFASDDEVHRVVEYLKQFGEPDYIDDILSAGVGSDDVFSNAVGGNNDRDDLYDEAVATIIKTQKPSISNLQRHLRIGYNRAASLFDLMEANGVISPAEPNGKRTILARSPDHSD
ncbi:DNA translocase FtsK [Neisseria chenwenguii]|uniref:DNA translocase FtsK n=1 Tax=Neisseria chenwenguii TaxID=1853278 RepID=UPI000F4EE323|nr:DNA translocase FtsK [Neisseria chenwenguii]ROV55469.1 cell division protein FtsK [Neisseria chenwenguii]